MNPPLNISASMEFESFWKPFIRVFQTLCVSNYCVFRPNLRHHLYKSLLFLAYFLLFSSLNILIVSIATARGLQSESEITKHQYLKHKESALMYYVNSLNVLGNWVVHLTIHLETLLTGKHEEAIFHKFQLINEIFATKLNHIPDFKSRRMKCFRGIVSSFIVSIILSVASSFTTLPELHHDKYFMQPILILAIIINRIRWCYLAIILSSLADTLNDLHTLLKQHQLRTCEQTTDNQYSHENIRYFREIYSNVWLIVTLVDHCFGWTFITFLVNFTFQTINASYWIYINLSVYSSMDMNIREYPSFLRVENIKSIRAK